MRKLLLGLLLVPGLVMANPINDKMNNIFDKLKHSMGVKARLVVSSDMEDNAMSLPGVVYFNKGMIIATKKDWNIIAYIMGHELSHIKFGDVYRETGPAESRRLEARADVEGVKAAIVVGYKGKEGACKFMKEMQTKYGNYGGGDHPNFDVRMSNIGCGK